MGLFFKIPISRKLNIVLNGGTGYYMAKATSLCSLNAGGITNELSTDVKANGFGINGGIAFEFKMGTNIGFFVELSGRYAKIGKFDGSGTEKSNGYSNITNGRLYYFEIQNWGNEKYYPEVSVYDPKTPPINPPSLTNMREAKIDFSGGSVRLGLIIQL